MSGPNPFSNSNAPQHNLVSKILTSPLVGAQYQVVVDLVDIHTAYPLQIGSKTNPVQLEYVNQIGTAANPVLVEYVTQIGNHVTPSSEINVQQLYATGIGSEAFPVDTEYVTQIGSPSFPATNIYTINLGSTDHPVGNEHVTQIGDTGSSGNAFFNEATIGTLYCSNIIPPPGGSGGVQYHAGSGIGITFTSTDSTISSLVRGSTGIGLTLGTDNYWDISLDVIGGTGISLVATGNTYTIQNTGVLSVTGGTGINVDNTDPQNPKIYSTAQSGVTGISGGTGISVLNPNSQFPTIFTNNIQNISAGTNVQIDFTDPLVPKISASGGSGGNPTGPTGQIPYFTPTGLLSVPYLAYTGITLAAPSIQVVSQSQTGMIGIATSAGDSSIFSGITNTPNSGNYLKIGQFQGPPTMNIDTLQGFVGIDKTPTVALDVAGQAVITYSGSDTYIGVTGGSGPTGTCSLAAGATYIVRAWGAGGAGNGGVGGAGGYAEVSFNTGATGLTLDWNQLYGGASGGGNALTVDFAGGATFLYVPGGGAGVVGGAGAAAGEPQGFPRPEAGTLSGSTFVSHALYNDLTSWEFTTTASSPLTGGVYTGGTINGNLALVRGSSVITFTPSLSDSQIGDGVTYTVPSGTVVSIQASNIFFPGATFTSLPNDVIALVSGSVLSVTDGVASATGGTGAAVFNGLPFTNPVFNGAQISTGPIGLNVAAGGVTWSTASTITFPATGATSYWFFDGNPGQEVTVEGNHIFTCPAGITLGIPYALVGITNSTIDTDGLVTIPSGSIVNVAERNFTIYGVTGTTFNGVGLGGGGFVGGGNSALITSIPVTGAVGATANNMPAGGGAGLFGFNSTILSGITGQVYYGSGSSPYVNKYNRYGVYGAGTTGATGNSGFLIVEQVITPTVPAPALFATTAVFGSGGLVAGTNLTCPGGSNQSLGNIVCNSVATTTGNLSVAGTSQLTGAVTCGASLTAGGLITAPSIGSPLTTVGTLNSLTVGPGVTAAAASLYVNGNATAVSVTVGLGGFSSAGAVTVGTVAVPTTVTVNGSVGATAVGAATGSITSLTVGGGATAPANSLLTNFPALLAAGIGSMGTGLTVAINGNLISTGHLYLGNLLVQWGNSQTLAGGGALVVWPIAYPAGQSPCVMNTLYRNGNSQYQFTICESLSNTGATFQSFKPDDGSPHYGDTGNVQMWLAFGSAV